MGMPDAFQQFFMFSGFIGSFSCESLLIGDLLRHFQISGYPFSDFPTFMGILFGNFSRLIGGTSTPYLGNSSYPLGKAGPPLI